MILVGTPFVACPLARWGELLQLASLVVCKEPSRMQGPARVLRTCSQRAASVMRRRQAIGPAPGRILCYHKHPWLFRQNRKISRAGSLGPSPRFFIA